MEKSRLNTPEVSNYGKEKYRQGYDAGYRAHTHDMNRFKDRKTYIITTKLNEFMSFIDDKIHST